MLEPLAHKQSFTKWTTVLKGFTPTDVFTKSAFSNSIYALRLMYSTSKPLTIRPLRL